MVYDYPPEESVLWTRQGDPQPKAIFTVPCLVCGVPADLVVPEHGWNLLTDRHKACE